jgi:hypothetical protein
MFLTRAGLKALQGKHDDVSALVAAPATVIRLPRKKSTGRARVSIGGQSLLVPWKHLSTTPPTLRSQQTLRRQLSGRTNPASKSRPQSAAPSAAPAAKEVTQAQADAVLVDAIQKQLNQALGLS